MKSVKSMVARTNEEEVLKILSEQAPVGVCIMQDGKFCYVNSYFSIVTGYTADELVGKDSFVIVVPEDREMVKENTLKMLKGELLSPYQFRVICKDDSIIWVMATVKSIQYHGRQAVLGNYMEVTERKQIEDAVRQSEENYRALCEQAPVGVCITQDGKFRYVNSNFPIAIGYTIDELIGKDSLEIVVPEDREMVSENTIKMLKGELLSPYQFRVMHKDGSIVWVMATVKSIQYHGRRAILGNYMEITERKQMEEALKESEEKYKELANSITNVFFAMDGQLRYTYWNKASEILTGIRAEDALGKSLLEIFPDTPGTRRAEKVYRSVMRTQQPRTFVNDYDLDGRHYIFEISAYPSRGGISVFVKDITEHKQAEEALRESEERYRALFDRSLDSVYVHDLEGNFLDTNETALKLLGYDRKDILHLNFASLLSEDQLPTAFATLQELSDTGTQKQVNQYRLRCKDGSFVDVETRAVLIYHDGKPYAIQGVGRDVTERKRAEERLREAEEEKSAFLEEAPVAIIHADLEGKITYVNRRFELESGYSREEIIGKVGLQLGWFSADTTKYLAERMAARLGGSPAKHWETQFKCKDGRLIWIELEGKIISKLGVPIGFQIISNNITERKQVEEALQKSEERYRVLAENAGEAILVVQDDVVKFVNPKGVELSGYSGEELASRPFAKFIHPDDIDMVADRYLRRLRGELTPQTYDFRIIRKDGAIRWGELNAMPISWEGRPAVLCFMSDVTEHKQAVEALRQSEERYRTILEEMEDAYFEVDLGGHFTFVNNSVCRDLGYSREELMGMSYKKFTVEDDIESVFRVFNEVYQTGVPNKGFPWKTTRKDGSHGFAETSVSPLRNNKGEIIGFRGVGRDITERKQGEEKLRQSKERYRALFDSSVIGTLVVDAETMKVVIGNQAAVKMFGFSSAEEGAEVNLLDFVPPGEKEKALELIKKELFEQDSRRTFDLQAVTKDGRKIWISATGARITHRGRLAGLLSFTDITERREMEEALNLQRARFQQLFDNSPDTIIMLDIDDRLIHANKGFEALFGYSTKELQGQSVRKLIIPEEDMEAASASLQRVLGGEIIRRETLRRRKDGSLVDVSILSYPIRLNDKVIGTCFTYTDITQRKKAEEKLRQSEENYKTLFNSSVIGMYVMDAETLKVVMGNRAAREMIGFSSAEEGIGVNPFDFVVPEDREKVLEIAINEFLQDSRRTHEVRIMDKNGQIGWQSFSIARIMHQGRLASLVSIMDITERKKVEEALRQSEENYRALFDSSVIGTIVLNAETMKIVMANQAAVKMFGLSSIEEGIGLNPLDFIPPDDREIVSKIIVKDMFEQDLRRTNELRAVTKDHREIWISATGARIIHEGRLAGLISFTDITEQKRQSERLMMTDRLASLGELAAGTAHELNNPLTSVVGFSQLLMEREVPDDIREDLKLIYNEAQRAANVTNNLLTFARKHAPVKQPTQINNIIEDMLKLRAYEHDINNIEVKKQLDPNLPEIMADYFQMQQVFINIIINAEYFMIQAHKKGTLTITTKKQNGNVKISIADDGPGIAPENLRRIFDPFFTTKEAGKGTGLGLSICHGIVAEHSGQIYARSELGEGATFIIELPVNGRDHIEGTP